MHVKYVKEIIHGQGEAENTILEMAYWKLVYDDNNELIKMYIKEYDNINDPWYELDMNMTHNEDGTFDKPAYRIDQFLEKDADGEPYLTLEGMEFIELTEAEMFLEIL